MNLRLTISYSSCYNHVILFHSCHVLRYISNFKSFIQAWFKCVKFVDKSKQIVLEKGRNGQILSVAITRDSMGRAFNYKTKVNFLHVHVYAKVSQIKDCIYYFLFNCLSYFFSKYDEYLILKTSILSLFVFSRILTSTSLWMVMGLKWQTTKKMSDIHSHSLLTLTVIGWSCLSATRIKSNKFKIAHFSSKI